LLPCLCVLPCDAGQDAALVAQLRHGRKCDKNFRDKDIRSFAETGSIRRRPANERAIPAGSAGCLNVITGEDMGARSLAISASTIALLSLSPAQAGNYDGPWSVELSTEQGECGLNYKGQLTVAGGRIAEGGLFVQTSGAVDASSRVAIRMTHGSDRLAAGGVLKGASGGGQWHSPTQQCSGRWRAARL
jgi:hypothetical protein